MTLQTYDVGDTVRLDATFTTSTGGNLDPTAVTFMYRRPSGFESSSTSAMQHPSSGYYYVDIIIDQAGTWRWRSYSTGNLNSAQESQFVVRRQWVGSTST